MLFIRCINLILRGSTLFIKFIFIIFAAKSLSLQEMGVYGIIIASMTYISYVVGLDFYTYSNREIINEEKKYYLINKQLTINVIQSAVVLLPIICMYFFDYFNTKLLAVLFILAPSEYFSQELSRLLIIQGKVLSASIQLFIRSALWGVIFIIMSIMGFDRLNLLDVLVLWASFSLVSCLFGWLVLFKNECFSLDLDLDWFFNGIKIAIPLFVATVFIRSLFTIDRFMLKEFDSINIVAVYTVYMSLCNAIMSFSDSAIFQFSYPRIVKLYSSRQYSELKKSTSKMYVQICFIFLSVILVYYFYSDYIFFLINKEEYLNYLDSFWLLLLAQFFVVISTIPHYELYAARCDKLIMIIHSISFIFFVVLYLILHYFFESEGLVIISVSMVLTTFLLFFTKSIFSSKHYKALI